MSPILHGYWRSGASYRVRIALNLKGVGFEQATYDLRQGVQQAATYKAIQPQGLVPALQLGDMVLTQSLAILEWLEETHPAPALLPAAPADRAIVRAMACLVACDIHPLNNLRVLRTLKRDFAAGEPEIGRWIGQWVQSGFEALETLVARHGDGFCFGDAPTQADCCLTPQVHAARRYNVDLSAFPRLIDAYDRANQLPAFQAARPKAQPDADPV